ncbi:MAG: PilZ domain-containing protein [Candidatus Omnitrophota bacterium]
MDKKEDEQRRYIRLSTVIPVEFHLIDEFGRKETPYLQGFTNNIGKGGICLVINDLWWGFADRLSKNVPLALQIELPFKKRSIFAQGKIVWIEQSKLDRFTQYRLGIEFDKSKTDNTAGLFKYALLKKSLPFIVTAAAIILSAFAAHSWLKEQKAAEEKRKLLVQYKSILQETANLRENFEKERLLADLLREKQEELALRLALKETDLSQWEKKYRGVLEKGVKSQEGAVQLKDSMVGLEKEIAVLKKENGLLKEKISQSQQTQTALVLAYKKKEKETSLTSGKIIEGMYEWICNRQDLKRGLVLSYEGDKNLDKVSFSYDQALAAVVFLIFDDKQRAERILDFYLNEVRSGRPIYNAYYTNGGVFEYVIHSGVDAWVGLASLIYFKQTKDNKHLAVAKKIAETLVDMMDKEGGIVGGPNLSWYSTEHNLDSFAFFKMFYEVSGNKEYLRISEKIKKWLDEYAYTDKGVPVNRGKGDATIATDTYSWSITALGPQALISLKMDPEEILDFAVKNCEVNTTVTRQNIAVKVSGFDFAKARHLARGGVVSCEWTSQMILAFEIMADYYREKDFNKYRVYIDKTVLYAAELQKMVINSPSPVGKANPTLPYASSANVDTGHGWRTPYGDRTGSLASTAYFLIAYRGFNPLSGKFLSVSLKDIYDNIGDNLPAMVGKQ